MNISDPNNAQRPTAEQADRLIRLALQVWELAPWEWMVEQELFGFRPPNSNEMYFVSVLGSLGEHYAMVVYVGPGALHDLLCFCDIGGPPDPFEFFEIPQMQVSFEKRRDLESPDLALLRKSAAKFAPNGYPMFRSNAPGFVPHYIEAADASILEQAMEHLLEVAPRVHEDPEFLDSGSSAEFLMRSFVDGKWVEEFENVPIPDEQSFEIGLTEQDLQEVRSLTNSGGDDEVWEADFFAAPVTVGARGGKRSIPRALLVTDADSGRILGTAMIARDGSTQTQFDEMVDEFINIFISNGMRPKVIRARSEVLLDFLDRIAEALDIEIVIDPNLDTIDEAREALAEYFQMR